MKRIMTAEKGLEFQMLWIEIKHERIFTITNFMWVVKHLSLVLRQKGTQISGDLPVVFTSGNYGFVIVFDLSPNSGTPCYADYLISSLGRGVPGMYVG